MASTQSPHENILAAFDGLTPKQRRLARFFLDNEDVVAFASAQDIGEQTDTSAATVVRLCRALGYEGYTDLQAAIRARFPQYRTAVQKLTAHMANGKHAKNLSAQIAQANTDNIQQTLSRVTNADLTSAVAAVANAQQIRIFGSGLSSAAAVYAEHALNTLGFSAHAVVDGGLDQIVELSRITGHDLVIVISVWRYFRATIEAAKATRAIGATCIALTDSPVAPVVKYADHVFVADIEGTLHSRSPAGIMSLIELFSAAIVVERPQESMAALRRLDTLYRQNDMLQSD